VAREIAAAVAEVAESSQEQVREEVKGLLRAVLDAASFTAAEEALARLQACPYAARLAQKVNEQFDRLLYPLLACHQGLSRIAPEWLWRDLRLRLSRGRNHGSEERLDRAGLLWMVYHRRCTPPPFTSAQWRSERKRKYADAPHPVTSWSESPAGSWELTRPDQLPGRFGGVNALRSFAVPRRRRNGQSQASHLTNNHPQLTNTI